MAILLTHICANVKGGGNSVLERDEVSAEADRNAVAVRGEPPGALPGVR